MWSESGGGPTTESNIKKHNWIRLRVLRWACAAGTHFGALLHTLVVVARQKRKRFVREVDRSPPPWSHEPFELLLTGAGPNCLVRQTACSNIGAVRPIQGLARGRSKIVPWSKTCQPKGLFHHGKTGCLRYPKIHVLATGKLRKSVTFRVFAAQPQLLSVMLYQVLVERCSASYPPPLDSMNWTAVLDTICQGFQSGVHFISREAEVSVVVLSI